jgi:hypothetical protein
VRIKTQALWVSGSFAVASRLAGQFAAISLLALLADVVVYAYASAVRRDQSERAPPAARCGAILGCFSIPGLALAVLAQAPLCLPPNTLTVLGDDSLCAGPLLVVVVLLWFCVAVALATCCSCGCRTLHVGLYVAWGAGETLVRVCAHHERFLVCLSACLPVRSLEAGGCIGGG